MVHITNDMSSKHKETTHLIRSACSMTSSVWKLVTAAAFTEKQTITNKFQKKNSTRAVNAKTKSQPLLLWLDSPVKLAEFIRKHADANRHRSTVGRLVARWTKEDGQRFREFAILVEVGRGWDHQIDR